MSAIATNEVKLQAANSDAVSRNSTKWCCKRTQPLQVGKGISHSLFELRAQHIEGYMSRPLMLVEIAILISFKLGRNHCTAV